MFNGAYARYSSNGTFSEEELKQIGAALLGLLDDLDNLLATNPNFLLGTWYLHLFRLLGTEYYFNKRIVGYQCT